MRCSPGALVGSKVWTLSFIGLILSALLGLPSHLSAATAAKRPLESDNSTWRQASWAERVNRREQGRCGIFTSSDR
ncbi:hypothetical protein GCM10010431_37530 [Streptomyces kunmingensis]